MNTKLINVIAVDLGNREVYQNFAQAYEAEFSSITRKQPNEKGIFSLDAEVSENNFGFLMYLDNIPAGFSVVTSHGNARYEVSEFYVVPCFRKLGLGKLFAHKIWGQFKGDWEVKQIQGAEYATQFWRAVIEQYVGQYQEDRYHDSYWGVVTRQQFTVTAR